MEGFLYLIFGYFDLLLGGYFPVSISRIHTADTYVKNSSKIRYLPEMFAGGFFLKVSKVLIP